MLVNDMIEISEATFGRRYGKKVRYKTYVGGLVEADAAVETRDGLEVLLGEIEIERVEVGLHGGLAAGLGDDGQAALGGPAEEDLGGVLVVLLADGLDGGVLEEGLELLGVLHVELAERGRAEGGVGGHGDALSLGEVEEVLLDEVGVVLDLEGGGADLGVAEEVVQELGLEVGDTDALGETLLDERLHGGPGLLDGGLGGADLALAVKVPAGRVADRGVDVLEGDGEVDQVEVEVVDTPVGELLADNGLDAVAVVEGVPELGDDEELLALDDALLDGAGNTLAALSLVAVVCIQAMASQPTRTYANVFFFLVWCLWMAMPLRVKSRIISLQAG